MEGPFGVFRILRRQKRSPIQRFRNPGWETGKPRALISCHPPLVPPNPPKSPKGPPSHRMGMFEGVHSFREKKKHINIKFAGLSRDRVGAQNLFMFFRVIPFGVQKTHKQNLPKKSRDNPVKICLCVFFFLSERSAAASFGGGRDGDVLGRVCRWQFVNIRGFQSRGFAIFKFWECPVLVPETKPVSGSGSGLYGPYCCC